MTLGLRMLTDDLGSGGERVGVKECVNLVRPAQDINQISNGIELRTVGGVIVAAEVNAVKG